MKAFLLVLFSFGSLFAFEEGKSPIDFSIRKIRGNEYNLSLVVPKGYAIQIEAPNKIKLEGKNGLEIKEFKSEFTGPIKLDKPEYFEKVNDMKVQLKGKGDLQIDSKIFYCDLNKGLCYPAKIQKTEKIL